MPDDVHDAREIVGEYAERHLGGNLWQRLHQEVRRAHVRLDRGEGMLDRLAALTHGLWIFIEPLLHRLDPPERNVDSKSIRPDSIVAHFYSQAAPCRLLQQNLPMIHARRPNDQYPPRAERVLRHHHRNDGSPAKFGPVLGLI